MPRRWRALGCFLLIAMTGATPAAGRAEPGENSPEGPVASKTATPPELQITLAGKRVEQWVAQLAAAEFKLREEARLALLSLEQEPDTGLPVVIALLKHPQFEAQMIALTVCQRMGPAAAKAIPHAVKRAEEPHASSQITLIAQAVAAMGEPANPRVIRGLVKHEIVQKVGNQPRRDYFAKYPSEVLPVLVQLLEDTDAEVRRNVSRAVRSMTTLPIATVATKPARTPPAAADSKRPIDRAGDLGPLLARLQQTLGDRELSVRVEAAVTLWQIDRTQSLRVLPALIDFVRQPADRVTPQTSIHSHYMTESLVHATFKEMGAAAVPSLIAALDDPRPEARRLVAHRLQDLSEPGLAGLRDALRAESKYIRAGACWGLRSDPAQAAAAKLVRPLLGDTDAEVKIEAAESLLYMREGKSTFGEPVRKTLDSLLTDASGDIRSRAALGFKMLGTAGARSRPRITKLLDNETDPRVKCALVQAYLATGRGDRDVVLAALLDVARRSPTTLRERELRELGRFGVRAQAALPALRTLLTEQTEMSELPLIECWLRIAPDQAEEPIARLRALLAQPHGGSQTFALMPTLVRLGPLAAPLADDLKKSHEMKRTGSDYYRGMRVVALHRLRPESREAMQREIGMLLNNTVKTSTHIHYTYAGLRLLHGKELTPFLPVLRPMLQSPQRSWRSATASLLNRMGDGAQAALPDLRAALDRETDDSVRTELTAAITRITQHAPPLPSDPADHDDD